ncbi:uncharacterized protein [Physcomitrium patens]|uniref:Uncharacterized protein n=1 Tax=Physcomitrium patens TaxID=3218 RepID=A0A2K1KPL1_PHYPA|nr:uncharacterized protein LOC112280867 isoform X1 [Physcomitrium patens]XP_024372529.1 uncharacterized protein LOC112280867 isoform X1 [Physcomitrium patens]PNR55718.1 hypothetical protein PHYPA_006615 [Physcomitrium patens]|eukprot:XP_024372528.1 uncharacterized protein LOC112280867 isoform X1 [Physcomitrella patens]
MSSWNAPYATLHDLPKYEKRPDVAGAPWSRDQAAVKSSRGQDPLPYVTCNSRTAPFATFHNTPNEADPKAEILRDSQPQVVNVLQQCASIPESFLVHQRSPINGFQFLNEHKHSAPSDISHDTDHHLTQASLSKIHQAPWDRNDVHYKVQPRFPHGEDEPHYTSSHAPYATDSQRG